MIPSIMAKSKTPTLTADMRIVLIHGDEPFLRTSHTQTLLEALQEAHGDITPIVYDGETVDLATVLDELRSYGLMQPYKMVILDNADAFLAAKGDDDDSDPGSPKANIRSAMERYAANPVDHATLVMRARTWRKGKIDKLIDKCGAIVPVKPCTPVAAAKWCVGRCAKRYGCTIDGQAASALVDRMGTALNRLDVELQKLAAYVGEGNVIQREDVILLGGQTSDEKAWAVQNAALQSPADAMSMLDELLAVPNVNEVPTSWALCDLTRKLYAACALRDQGVAPGAVSKRLRLWGEAQRLVMNAAGRLDRTRAAKLSRVAISADQRLKSRPDDKRRTLESVTIQLADTIHS